MPPMGMNMTEKIRARHAGKVSVAPGENIWVDVDVLMTHDVCGPGTIQIFHKQFGAAARVWDREKVVVIPDHYIFTKDLHAHRNLDLLRSFVTEQQLPYFYDVGTPKYKGVCHIALPEEGHTRPGEVLFGTDSHTCTAGAFGEFATGIGNTDAALIMGIGKLWVKVPETMRFVFEGPLPPYLIAKDLILHIIGDIGVDGATRSEEHTSELQSQSNLVCRLLLEKKKHKERETVCKCGRPGSALSGPRALHVRGGAHAVRRGLSAGRSGLEGVRVTGHAGLALLLQ